MCARHTRWGGRLGSGGAGRLPRCAGRVSRRPARHRSSAAAHVLDPGHDDLRAGAQVREVDVRVVLLHQPQRHLGRTLSQRPQRVPGPGDVKLGAHDPVRGEEAGLERPVILATARFERLMRHLAEIEPDVLTDEYPAAEPEVIDRKSTRLNSSHSQISYAVFCLKKKKKKKKKIIQEKKYHSRILQNLSNVSKIITHTLLNLS